MLKYVLTFGIYIQPQEGTRMRCAEAHPQSWIRPNFLFLGGRDDRNVNPEVSKRSQSQNKTEIVFLGGGS